MGFKDWLSKLFSRKIIPLTQEEKEIIKRYGFLMRNIGRGGNLMGITGEPEMIMTEKYALKVGISKKQWNKTKFMLHGWAVPHVVLTEEIAKMYGYRLSKKV